MHRMRVFGMEKFNNPTFIATINYYLNTQEMDKRDVWGMIALYVEQDYLEQLDTHWIRLQDLSLQRPSWPIGHGRPERNLEQYLTLSAQALDILFKRETTPFMRIDPYNQLSHESVRDLADKISKLSPESKKILIAATALRD